MSKCIVCDGRCFYQNPLCGSCATLYGRYPDWPEWLKFLKRSWKNERARRARDAECLVPYDDEIESNYFANCQRLADEGMTGIWAGAGCDEDDPWD